MSGFSLDLRTLLSNALRSYAGRPAVVADGRTWSFAELDEASNRLSHALLEAGVGPSTPVALMMSNCAEYVVADLAVLKLGAAKVPLNDMLSAEEAHYILRDSGASVALTTPSQHETATGYLATGAALHTLIATDTGSGSGRAGVTAWAEALAGRPVTQPEVEISSDDIGLIMYTGGTTGRPKGVVHRQRQLALNQLAHRIESEIRSDDRLLLSSPLPHSAGLLLQTALCAGATTHITRSFDPAAVLRAVEQEGVSYLFLVPTMIYRLLDQSAAATGDYSALRTILYGAAPMSAERLAEGLERFGPVFVQLYGQSEAPNFITRLAREDHVASGAEARRLRSCGRPTAMAEVCIVDADGQVCPPGGEGEVLARTAFTMTEYHRQPDVTARTLRDGWLHTGDIGYLEDGYLYLLDRKNDMVISGGMNVYCSEVEAAVAEVGGVGQVAVAGLPHPDWGEAVVAFVVPDPEEPLDEDAVRAHCRVKLSAYKRPKAIARVDSLPLTAYGKVDKKALRACWPGWS